MKKLRLDFESIEVESFDTSPLDPRQRGTVHGRGTYHEPCTGVGDCLVMTNEPCAAETTTFCQAGTFQGDTCDTTCHQIQCTCTNGGFHNGTCDINATCYYYATCAYETGCYYNC